MDDTMDLLHDQGFHHHILSLPPNNITLGRVFRPIYRTLTVVECDAYEESYLRLVDRQPLQLPPFILPVTVEDPPTPFSPFSLANCTMLSHFSFNDFVAVAFPDIARDLDIQI